MVGYSSVRMPKPAEKPVEAKPQQTGPSESKAPPVSDDKTLIDPKLQSPQASANTQTMTESKQAETPPIELDGILQAKAKKPGYQQPGTQSISYKSGFTQTGK